MFIVERIIGVCLYAFLLLLIFLFLNKKNTKRNVANILNFYLVFLCIMSFFYIPTETADLYRWREISRDWNTLPFNSFLKDYLFTSSSPLAYLIMYLSSFLNEGFLPAFCAFILFSNIFYILKNLNAKHNVNSLVIANVLFFIMSTGFFLEAISGVRCLVSLSILARCFYNEFYNNYNFSKVILLEICASLIHPMALVLTILRFLFFVFQKEKNIKLQIKKIVTSIIVVVIAFLFGSKYIISAFNKFLSYVTSFQNNYFYFWEYLIGILSLLIILFILIDFKKNCKNNNKNYLNFLSFLIIISFAVFFEYSSFRRLITFVAFISMPLLCDYLKLNTNKAISRKKLLMFSVVLLFIASARGNLSGYKFFIF